MTQEFKATAAAARREVVADLDEKVIR